jgi:hypothetical protein
MNYRYSKYHPVECIYQSLNLLFNEQYTELRAIYPSGRVDAGFFDKEHKRDLLIAARELNKVANIYTNLNVIDDENFSRSSLNKVVPYAKDLTKNEDISIINYLLVDLDPVRPSNTSSSEEELDSAIKLSDEIKRFLSKKDWPEPVVALSGNGVHLIYHILHDDCYCLSNSDENVNLIKQTLKILDKKFTSDKVKVDTSVGKAGQITKLYGTISMKGEADEKRPHRQSRIISTPPDYELGNPSIAVFVSQIKFFIEENKNLLTVIPERKSPNSVSLIPFTPRNEARLKAMLNHIDPDCDYQTYRNVIWAIRDTNFPNAEEIARNWSIGAGDRFDENTLQTILESFDPTKGITFATLVFLAKKGGYHE